MLYLLAGSLFLLVVRPYEHFTFLGDLHVERFYLIIVLIAFALFPKKKIKMDSILVLYFMYWAALWICSLFGLDFENSYQLVFTYMTESIVFVMMIFTIHDERGYVKIIELFSIITAIYVFLSLREFLGGRFHYAMGMSRMVGFDVTYGQSNSFSSTLVLSFPMLWVLLRTGFISKKVRYILYGYVPVSIFCLFQTGSRSGLVQCCIFFLMILGKSKKKFMYIIMAVAMLVVVWPLLPQSMHDRYYSLIDPSVAPESAHESAEGRIEGFLHGINVWAQNPLFGVGPNNLIYTWPDRARGFQAHNLVAQVLSDTGLFGAIPFVLLFSLCYFRSNWLMKTGRNLAQYYDQNPNMEWEAKIMDFISKTGAGIKQLIVILFVAGLTGHNMLRYTWVYVVYLTVVGTWITHKYLNMRLEENEKSALRQA
ncbi:MAG: O-antigen ligase family protein [Pseudodesulfovibrio sp.]|uniref:O-antigen ligase family protein n=1 Tax=Pseudodesulfovibrio sp. TaxID=2035812 RepID=UPI003D148B64